MKTLVTKEAAIDASLAEELRSVGDVAGTTDIWSDSSRNSHASLTMHKIDEKWNYCSDLVAFSLITERHIGRVLSQFITTTAGKYCILKKLIFVSNDNVLSAVSSIQLTAKDHAIMSDFYEKIEMENRVDATLPPPLMLP